MRLQRHHSVRKVVNMKLLVVAAFLAVASATVIKDDVIDMTTIMKKDSLGE